MHSLAEGSVMYLFLITVLLAFFIISASLWLASFRHAPKYHTEQADFACLLNYVLSGQATYEQWSAVMHIPVRHDPDLEALRQRCIAIENRCLTGKPAELGKPEAMFSSQGLALIEEELSRLRGEHSLTA